MLFDSVSQRGRCRFRANPLPYRDPKLPVEQRVATCFPDDARRESGANGRRLGESLSFLAIPRRFLLTETETSFPDHAGVSSNTAWEKSPARARSVGRAKWRPTPTRCKRVKENTRLGIPVLFTMNAYMVMSRRAAHRILRPSPCLPPGIPRSCKAFLPPPRLNTSPGRPPCLAPVLDLARDPRWGQQNQTYGEDPYLVSRLGLAAILGFQGTGAMDGLHVDGDGKTFCRPWPARGWDQRWPGQLFRAGSARIFSEAL